MTEMLTKLGHRLRSDARGLTTVEYTIVLCLIAALCVATWKTFGERIQGSIVKSDSAINDSLEGSFK